ncbi:MAG: endolytic transglycosylase MltG, partial [Schleiferiaceae bacterium]|nr:endolytic transglycosylase MltG [Schleiferiaceae bacterium]
ILSDMATVASLYLTRLARGMKLESDPTVIFAVMDREPGHEKIRRVSRAMTKLDHPYNTYQINGLPPKPLATVDSHIIDLVLDARPGEYLFMCADPDRPGHHNFAKTHGGHILNKLKYVAWLNGQGIYR